MIDMADIVSDPDFTSPITIIRQSGTFDNEGEFSQTSAAPITVQAVVQPATETDKLNVLPEGERQNSAIRIYSPVQIMMGDGAAQHSDIIEWDGGRYRVAMSKPWQMHGYWMAIAVGFANV